MTGADGSGTSAGATVGVEEEFHLVDPGTLALTPGTRVVAAALAGEAGEHVHPEIVSTQLETSTPVCTTLAELRDRLAADKRDLDVLTEALAVQDERFWDEPAGLVVEEWDRAWTRLDTYRGVNANMHTVEAYLAAGDVTGDAGWHRRAGRMAATVAGWARGNDWRIPEHFTADWTPLPDYNREHPADPFRPYGVTVGHQFEWARLCLHLRAALRGQKHAFGPSWLLDDAVALFRAAATRGWAADGHDGFPYTLGWDDRPVVGARMHWVLCEAVAAAMVLAEVTGEAHYRELAARWRAHGEDRFADPATGSWHHELTPEGAVATGTWEGQPDAYHLAQMLLLPGHPVRGSVAASLR